MNELERLEKTAQAAIDANPANAIMAYPIRRAVNRIKHLEDILRLCEPHLNELVHIAPADYAVSGSRDPREVLAMVRYALRCAQGEIALASMRKTCA